MMSAEAKFWTWFAEHESAFFDFENDQEPIFDKIQHQLSRIDKSLSFEFGPKQNGVREFVVSASGIKSSFSAVRALTQVAPKLPRWKFIAFRPRRNKLFGVRFGAKQINPADVQFALLDDGKTAGIYLFIRGYAEGDRTLAEIGYLFLDQALGEEDVETKLGPIKMLPFDAEKLIERYPLSLLPEQFDKLVQKLRSNGNKRHE